MQKYPELLIITKGLRKDKVYLGLMIGFWIIWTPITLFAVAAAIYKFTFFWVLWLPFGFAGVILISISLFALNCTHLLIAEPDGIRILSDRALLQREVFIKKEDLKSVMLGVYDSGGESESVITLNLFKKSGWFNNRIMLAPFVHPDDKRKIYSQIVCFLDQNKFSFDRVTTQTVKETEQLH
jgi:hypothetical protein